MAEAATAPRAATRTGCSGDRAKPLASAASAETRSVRSMMLREMSSDLRRGDQHAMAPCSSACRNAQPTNYVRIRVIDRPPGLRAAAAAQQAATSVPSDTGQPRSSG
eukprot:5040896-Prymnesium_polylepis.1